MIIHWGCWKLRVEQRDVGDGIIFYVVVCQNCGSVLKNPFKPIFANETGYVYCSKECAKADVKEEAERRRAEDPDWKGF